MASTGSLTVDFRANSARLTADLGKAQRAVNSFGARSNKALASAERASRRFAFSLKGALGSITRMVPGVGALAGGVGLGGLALLTKRALETADAIAKIADKTGFTTSQLQELRFAADQNGVAQRTLDMALQRFSRRVGEVAKDTGELLKVAQQYGVSLRDQEGQMRSNIDILRDFANIIRDAESEQEALRISFKLFDSEGAALVNLMRKGADGIEEYRRQARELGLVMDESLIRGAEAAKDKLSILAQVIEMKMTAAIVSLAPEIGAAADAILRVTKAASAMAPAIKAAAASVWELSKRVLPAVALMGKFAEVVFSAFDPAEQSARERAIEGLTGELQSLLSVARMLANDAALGGFLDPLGEKAERTARRIAEVNAAIRALESDERRFGGLGPVAGASAASAATGTTTTPPRTDKDKYKGRVFDVVAPSDRALIARGAAATGALAAQQERANEALKEGAAVYAATRTPLERYNAEVDRLTLLLEKGSIDQDTFRRATRAARDALEDSAQATMGVVTAQDVLTDAIAGNISSFEDLGRIGLKVLTDLAIKAAGFGGAGGGSDFGSQISSAVSLILGGFQHGGSFKVGGVGGPDSQLVAFRASPGERVDITPERGTLGGVHGGGGGGLAIEVYAPGAGPGTADQIRRAVGEALRLATPALASAGADLVTARARAGGPGAKRKGRR